MTTHTYRFSGYFLVEPGTSCRFLIHIGDRCKTFLWPVVKATTGISHWTSSCPFFIH